MILRYVIVCFIALSFVACDKGVKPAKKDGFLKVDGQNFVDSKGRQVILSGINFISKDPNEKYMPLQGKETFEQFESWGFNCIRLGIIWDGLEPEPGQYNEAYLKEIDKRIEWASEHGLYVFLDMHQDLYGAKFSDGAPDWATLDEGKPHQKGAVWSDSYLISPAVQAAFDNFWNNAPAPDGIGVQDHYVKLWQHIAMRYAHNTTVIGYDLMNEPFMGTSAQEVMPLMLGAYAQVLAEETGQEPPSADELGAMWADEESRLKALELIATKEKYSKVVDAVYDLSAKFERTHLQSMYQKVANAIRQVDTNHILFFNHNYFVNTGVSTALEATTLPDGSRDPQVAYAAHGYDLVVDTKEVENPSYERVEFIFERIAESGKRMDMPVLLGEWGALHGKSPKMVETAQHLVNLIEKYDFSNTYWAYYGDIADYPYFQDAIIRPFPQVISGKLISYDFDFETGEFFMQWDEEAVNQAPTIIYLPWLSSINEEISIKPESEKLETEQIKNSDAGWLMVPPTEKGGTRTMTIQFLLQDKEEYLILEQ
ncbi:cellulase family glycosylhydrolase [Sunxiuqinia sp. sy24]|uniref:cellulase family glycosylhydrolase n=1 Tax=Sunxiuqinia sp. sy24 TaxID=3461495 RepID=UPI0040466A24